MHPLVEDLSKLSDEDLNNKITDLSKRMNQAYRFGQFDALQQIQMFIDSYQSELQNRQAKAMQELAEKSPEFKNIIDIK